MSSLSGSCCTTLLHVSRASKTTARKADVDVVCHGIAQAARAKAPSSAAAAAAGYACVPDRTCKTAAASTEKSLLPTLGLTHEFAVLIGDTVVGNAA
jgi:hypothetical protein